MITDRIRVQEIQHVLQKIQSFRLMIKKMEKLPRKYPYSSGAKFDLTHVRPSIERYTQRVRRLRDYIANCVLQRTFTFNRKTDRQYIEFRDAAKLRHSTIMEEYLNEFKPVYDLIDALKDANAIDILQPQN